MLEEQTTPELNDAETEFRRRLAEKLTARGYSGAALARKIEELLRLEIPLRLLPDETADLPRP
jgi:hypothetical protein